MKKPNSPKKKTGRARTTRRSSSEVPAEAIQLAKELTRLDAQRRREEEAAGDRAAEEMIESGRRLLRELASDAQRRAMSRRARELRAALRARMQPPGGLRRDYRNEFEKARRQMNEYLHGIGIAADKYRDAIREIVAVGRKAQRANFRPAGKRPGKAAPSADFTDLLSRIAKSELFKDPHRFFTFQPPFFSGAMGFGTPNTRGLGDHRWASREVALDLEAGLVGHKVMAGVEGAGELDQVNAVADTQVEFFFKAPVAGLVEVLIEAQCGFGIHHLVAEDEFGISFADFDQQNFLMMHVMHPNVTAPSLAPLSRFPWGTDKDYDEETREHLVRGSDHVAQLFSDGPVPGGQSVLVRAGTRTHDSLFVNDMTVTSTSHFQWFLKRIHVRIAP